MLAGKHFKEKGKERRRITPTDPSINVKGKKRNRFFVFIRCRYMSQGKMKMAEKPARKEQNEIIRVSTSRKKKRKVSGIW